MRISDWSSDVCSSDLAIHHGFVRWRRVGSGAYFAHRALFRRFLGGGLGGMGLAGGCGAVDLGSAVAAGRARLAASQTQCKRFVGRSTGVADYVFYWPVIVPRSVEHTYDLQSLMLIP